MRVGAEHVAFEAEPGGRERQHAAELSAAENADGGIAAERLALHDHASSFGLSATASVCCLRQASSRAASAGSAQRQHARGEQRRIDRAGLADRERADRHARRHLHDRIERVEAGQRLGFDRHAEHRQRGHRGRHAGQVRGAAGARDDHLAARRLGALGEGVEPLGRAVGRDDALVIGRRRARRASRRRGAWSASRTGCP